MNAMQAAIVLLSAVEKAKREGAYNGADWQALEQLAQGVKVTRITFGLDENNRPIKQPEAPPVEENPVSSSSETEKE